jgi:hypothetical protein
VEPEPQARFDALCDALMPLDLAAAGRALEAGRVRDLTAGGAAVAWQAAPMVLPVSGALRARLESPEYAAAYARARAAQTLRLDPAETPGQPHA